MSRMGNLRRCGSDEAFRDLLQITNNLMCRMVQRPAALWGSQITFSWLISAKALYSELFSD